MVGTDGKDSYELEFWTSSQSSISDWNYIILVLAVTLILATN